jgi:1-deoxy-D-xylulose-5-phosphate reductoisomerase
MASVTRITLLGATGSIGRSTADIIMAAPEAFDVQAVTANTDSEGLAALAQALGAKHAVIADENCHADLRERLRGTEIEVSCGDDAVTDAAALPADTVMAGIVGMAGLAPVMAAIGQGCRVAIANKEPLVAAGPLVMEAARRHGAELVPVDSEHNAVFQVFEAGNIAAIEKIVLTASGGPFRTWSLEQMRAATPEQAVAHPNWSMGRKISVDSASMMNKALEVIEAHYLFGLPPEKIEVLVHPQSTVHAMVGYSDGSFLAQLGAPDMRTPISHALAWPGRRETPGRRLDLAALRRLDFEPLDEARFPAVSHARACLQAGQAACLALNAANEVAVAAFLAGRIGFLDIYDTAKAVHDRAELAAELASLEQIMEFDRVVRRQAEDYIDSLNHSGQTGTAP